MNRFQLQRLGQITEPELGNPHEFEVVILLVGIYLTLTLSLGFPDSVGI